MFVFLSFFTLVLLVLPCKWKTSYSTEGRSYVSHDQRKAPMIWIFAPSTLWVWAEKTKHSNFAGAYFWSHDTFFYKTTTLKQITQPIFVLVTLSTKTKNKKWDEKLIEGRNFVHVLHKYRPYICGCLIVWPNGLKFIVRAMYICFFLYICTH